MQTITWRGLARSCYFLVQAPADAADRVYHVRARVLLASVPVGMLRFTLKGAAAEQPVDAARTIRGEWAQRYRYAFLSYASGDRAEVLKRAQALKAAHIDFFHDLLTLEPGERWERRLYEEIDRCDLFLLFWSSGAARSEWVVREAEYALHRSETSAERIPDIAPVMIEGPPIPRPPDSLKHLHFNDPLCYVIATVQSEQPARP
jgi:TIR domain